MTSKRNETHPSAPLTTDAEHKHHGDLRKRAFLKRLAAYKGHAAIGRLCAGLQPV